MNPVGTRMLANRLFTLGWLCYPAMLFALPNSVQLWGIAPESFVVILYLSLFFFSVLNFGRPVAVRHLTGPLTIPWLAFGALFVWGIASRGAPLDGLRAASWLAVLFLSAHLFWNKVLRSTLWKIWVAIGTGGALLALVNRPFPMPEVVNILAWTHRTGLGYFTGASLLVAMHLLATVRGFKRVGIMVVAFALTITLVGTLARGAWIATAIGVLVFYARRPIRAVIITTAIGTTSWGVISTASSGWLVSERMMSLVDVSIASSSEYRVDMYAAVLGSLHDSWLFGAGTVHFGTYLAQYSPVVYPQYFESDFETDADLILLVLVGGLPLLVSAIVAWGQLLRSAVRVLGDDVGDGRLRAALFFVFLTQILFDNVLSSAYGWFLMGVFLTLERRRPIRQTSHVAVGPRRHEPGTAA